MNEAAGRGTGRTLRFGFYGGSGLEALLLVCEVVIELSLENGMKDHNRTATGGGVRISRRQQTGFIAALLVITAAVIGIIVAAKAMRVRQSRIEDVREEIVSLLDQLDPIARVQVAQYVFEKELGKQPGKIFEKKS